MLDSILINELEKKHRSWKLKILLRKSIIVAFFLIVIFTSWLIIAFLPNFAKNLSNEQVNKPTHTTSKPTKFVANEPLHVKTPTHEFSQSTISEPLHVNTPTSNQALSQNDHIEIPHVKAKKQKTQNATNYNFTNEDIEVIDDVMDGDVKSNNDIYFQELQEQNVQNDEQDSQNYIQLQSQDIMPNEPKIQIQTTNIENYSKLKEKFYESNNIIYALILAEEYYHAKEYKEALKWSLIANNMDSKNERSWIIFAKAKAKNGSPKEAIKALKAYLSTHQDAKEISILIKKIQSGDY